MKEPARCYDGLILVLSLKGNIEVKVDGKIYRDQEVYLINNSSLYKVLSNSAILFYFPSNLFSNYNIDTFNRHFIVNNFEETRFQLITLFNYYKSRQTSSLKAQNVLKELLLSITENEILNDAFTKNLLDNIIQYISNNLHNRITLETLSNKFYISKSSISSLFKKQLNMSFYDYITSLKIAKSIENLVTTSKKIEIISQDWNYPSATNYIIHFRKIIGTTPKKYRSLPSEGKALNIKGLTNEYDIIKNLFIDYARKKENIEISIRDKDIKDKPFTYFNLIDIGNYQNLDAIINEPIFNYKNFANYKVPSYIYISEPLNEIKSDSFEKVAAMLRKLLKTKISIALEVTNIEYYQFISKVLEELHFLEMEHLPTSSVQDGNILLLFDLNLVPLSDIKNIHRNIYGTKILISLDITEYYTQRNLLSNKITHLNPDFYTIDFKKVDKQESFEKLHEELDKYLQELDVQNSVIFLNYEKVYTPKLLNNISGFLDHTLNSRNYLAGASIRFTKKNTEDNVIAVFDEIENKTLFFFLGIMLLNFSRYPCFYGENHLITKNPHSYNILLYNTDDTFARNVSEYTKMFSISFDEKNISTQILVSSELLNNNYGSLEGIVSHNITNRKLFPDSLKYKLSQYNKPLLKIDEHNFNGSPYVVEVPPKSIMMITLYY